MRVMLTLQLLTIPLVAQGWKTWLEEGIEAFNVAHYPEAVAAFEKAVELNPDEVEPHLYLGVSWYVQYIPGADGPETEVPLHKARSEFGRVLELEPNNLLALQYRASLSFYTKEWDDAISSNKKVIAVDPRNKRAYYMLGVIAWVRFYSVYGAERARLGMKADSPGPFLPSVAKLDLKDEFSSLVDEGIANLQKALEIDPDYAQAMAYLSLLIRERGDLLDLPAEWERAAAMADEWSQKAIEAKEKRVASAPDAGHTESPILVAPLEPAEPPPVKPAESSDLPETAEPAESVEAPESTEPETL